MDDTKKARAYADLMRLVNGYQISQAVHVVASLGVAYHLHDTACSIEELASLTASHPGALYRLLRALASVGVLHEGENKTFSLTEMGECLRSDAPMPVGAWAVHIGRPYFWQSWGQRLGAWPSPALALRLADSPDRLLDHVGVLTAFGEQIECLNAR